MKNTILKKAIAVTAAAAMILASAPATISEAAVTLTDNHSISAGIDSLTTTSYSCKAANNVSYAGSAENVIKIHLKEHNDMSSTGKRIEAFSIFTDDPEWMNIVAVDDGVDCNTPHVIDEQNYPNSRYTSGRSITVGNHSAEEDAFGRRTYEGGAYVFLVANSYNNAGEETDRQVGVTIVSRSKRGSTAFEDLTNITINIDAKDPEPEPEIAPEPEVERAPELQAPTPSAPTNAAQPPAADIKAPEVSNSPKPSATPQASEEPQESPEPEKKPEVIEENDDPTESADEVTFDIGDEIESPTAIYTVTDTNELEYSDIDDEDSEVINIPKSVKADGVTFKVTSIGDEAFKGNTTVKEITVGSNIAEIGDKAFWGCSGLRVLKITTTKLKLSNIGSQAFKKLSSKLVIKAPKSKLKTYKKIFQKKGLNKKVRFKAI